MVWHVWKWKALEVSGAKYTLIETESYQRTDASDRIDKTLLDVEWKQFMLAFSNKFEKYSLGSTKSRRLFKEKTCSKGPNGRRSFAAISRVDRLTLWKQHELLNLPLARTTSWLEFLLPCEPTRRKKYFLWNLQTHFRDLPREKEKTLHVLFFIFFPLHLVWVHAVGP